MKQIFAAARKLTSRPNRSMSYGSSTLPDQLRAALHVFEQTNRGHAHLLNELDPDNPYRGPYPKQKMTIRNSLRSLTYALVQADDNTLPTTADFNALLDAEDTRGWLLQDYQQAIYSLCSFQLKLPAGFNSDLMANGEIKFTLRKRGLATTRKIDFTFEGAQTLRNYKRNLLKARNNVNALTKDIENWPEFGEKVQQAALRQQFAEQLGNLFGSYSQEERQYIADNWNILKPAMLHKATSR